ncbi:hypothetical protein BDY21DRAFT_12216 [Lineolata rhizophorae]|uniref:RNA binding protein Nrd1 n=1 Tax=Lineolata rhizophorae TaxID=578093 RepID=A0A6A6PED9_9PEZI|nr:hypothetical protein BDY21DRAFT_12216 [Lineolata rhizophorae]
MAAVEELGKLLQEMQALKAPGVTKSKIEAITALCITNVQFEASLIQKICLHFRSTPSTHKLGVLYVVDSVTRQWVEKARQTGQELSGSSAAAGTYAAGVYKMTEILPHLMNEMLSVAPDNQKEKIQKLVDIWERGNTFPQQLLAGFKQKLSSVSASVAPQPATAPAAGPPDAASILSALAQLGTQSSSTPTAPTQQTQPDNRYSTNSAIQPLVASSLPAVLQNAGAVAANSSIPWHGMPAQPAQAPAAAANSNPFASLIPPQANQQPAAQQPAPETQGFQVQLVQELLQKQYGPEQIAQIFAALQNAQLPGMAPAPSPAIAPDMTPSMSHNGPGGNGNETYAQHYSEGNRPADHNDAHDYQRHRHRSRSPDYRRRGSPPRNRRDSPTYGAYDPNIAQSANDGRPAEHDRKGRGGRGRGRRDEYRQRSPPPQRSRQGGSPKASGPKWVEFDKSLPSGCIKVLSRTLFVGGVTTSESEVRNIFSRFGKVQTCIVNHDKRHAFVKMIDRHDAVSAKEGMDKIKDQEIIGKVRSTRWGVGFGPRECSDYSTGISIIPINSLTDADRKWVVNAEFGGIGGRPLEPGLVLEEPDIEIGAGVSSKAISRRVGPEGGRRGGHGFSNRGGFDPAAPRYRKPERQAPEPPRQPSPRSEPHIGPPPPVPTFGFQLPTLPGGVSR